MLELKHFTHIRRWYVLHIFLCIIFLISGLLINVAQLTLYFTLRPFNKSLFRTINYYLIYSLMSQILFLAEWWSGSDIRLHTSDDGYENFGKEHAIVIMNHTFEVDWLFGWITADRCHILGGAKVFVKNMMKYVPTLGWAWGCSDIIFLHRNWQKDKSIMENQVKEFFDYPYPVWMLLFCEGTRFTLTKHKASMEVARQKGLPELKHHLLPRTRGFIQCAQSMREHFKYIYDVTVCFDTNEGAEPTLVNMLRGKKVIADLYVRRIDINDVPLDDAGAIKYLNDLYQVKDKLFDSYVNTGSFTQENDLPAYKLKSFPRRYWSLINMVGWGIFVFSILSRYYYYLLTTGSFLANALFISFFLIACLCLYKMIGLTKIEKGSKYGNIQKKSE